MHAYINYLPSPTIMMSTLSFGNNCKILGLITFLMYCLHSQNDQHSIHIWSSAWKLPFNLWNAKWCIITHKLKSINITIHLQHPNYLHYSALRFRVHFLWESFLNSLPKQYHCQGLQNALLFTSFPAYTHHSTTTKLILYLSHSWSMTACSQLWCHCILQSITSLETSNANSLNYILNDYPALTTSKCSYFSISVLYG